MSSTKDPNTWMSEEIFKTLSGLGHEIYMYDKQGARVYDPSVSDRLFSNTAKMMITLGYTKGKPQKPLVTFHTSSGTEPHMLDDIKRTLKQHNLFDHSFDTLPYGRTLEPRQFAHMNEPVTESVWTGSTRTSRWRSGVTEVVIRHSERLADSENPLRWTRIRDIFIHGKDGSRYKMPVRSILGAKALAQHMDQQGDPWDTQASHIHNLLQCHQELRKLRRWAQQNDQPDLVTACVQCQDEIKVTLRKISQAHSYAQAIQAAGHMCEEWQQHAHSCEQPWAQDMMWAPGAVLWKMPVDAEAQPWAHAITTMSSWPEQQQLSEWFDQFDPHLQEKQSRMKQDVHDAAHEEQTEDPRQILANLKSNIPGWSSRFEHDPQQVLDQIDQVLNQLRAQQK